MCYMEVIQMEEKEKTKGALRGKSHPLSGERSRKEGSSVIGKRKRGWENAALAIVEDPELLRQAQVNSYKLKYDLDQ